MKYIIVVLLSAAFTVLTVQTAPALTNKAVHNDMRVKTTASAAPTLKSVLPKPEKAVTVATPAPQPVSDMTHAELMAAAGIQPEDYGAADYIITHESNWNPEATEPTTGAHGLPQALPYSKTGCGWSDELCQLRWANSYAVARYGGWWQAQAYWSTHWNW